MSLLSEKKLIRLIDAEELKHILNNSKYYGTKIGNAFADMITECKTIEARKKGKWIGKPIAGYCTVQCSVCKNMFRENNGRWNFCPDCGADMREGI